jgi:hypothetical protein
VLAIFEFLGGIVMSKSLWPGAAREGYEWTPAAYAPAVAWLMAGVIFGCLFLAIADGLIYLSEIRDALVRRK